MKQNVFFEVSPPSDPKLLAEFFEDIKYVFKLTPKLSIASNHNKELGIDGFDRGYNLLRYLRQIALLDENKCQVTFHLTCHDLNRANIRTRLELLRQLKVHRLLITTGLEYQLTEDKRRILFGSSDELIKYIIRNFSEHFENIGMAAYIDGQEYEAEIERLEAKWLPGVTSLHVQFTHNVAKFELFRVAVKNSQKLNNLDIFASLAVFNNYSSLAKLKDYWSQTGYIDFVTKQLSSDAGNQPARVSTKFKLAIQNLAVDLFKLDPNLGLQVFYLRDTQNHSILCDFAFDVIEDIATALKILLANPVVASRGKLTRKNP